MKDGNPDIELIAFGLALKKIRERKGLSQRKAHAEFGIEASEISRTERAKNNPTVKTLRKLLKGLEANDQNLIDVIMALVRD